MLEKIVVNVGVGRMSHEPSFEEKILPEIMKELALITGQKPEVRRAKQSIAGFKVRAGQIVGVRVTLRRRRMKDFLSRFVHVALPRVRDFRGINLKSVDGAGNLTFGVKEHVVFPEINPEQSRYSFGLEITCVANVKNRAEAVALYRSLGIPLKKE